MHEPIETIEHAGLTVKIFQDWDAECPRKDRDNLATMVAFPQFSRDYDIAEESADSTEIEAVDRRQGLLERYLRLTEGAEIALFRFDDHGSSGARLYEIDYDDAYASGFFSITRADIVKEYGNDSPESREKARSVLQGEINEMSQYVEGDVYGYVIDLPDDAPVDLHDSCWGFYGFDYCVEEAKEAAEWLARELNLEIEPDLETTIYQETR